jgi:predicted CxxxxCH...CXXCH cytochrome family protein
VSFDNGGSYASPTCSNTLCHQQGNANLSGGADNLVITWDCTVNAGCRRCHGSQPAGGIYAFNSVAGEPNYVSGGAGVPTSNSHQKHVAAAGDCKSCHRATVSGTAIDNAAFASEHINDNVEVFPGPGITFTWTAGTHTCANISCHGNNPATWGDTGMGCANCHARTGDVDDFGTGTLASMFRNGVTSGIDNSQWLWSGHGKDSGSYDCTANLAANLVGSSSGKNKCKFCHDDAVGHNDAANPFRLTNNNWQSLGWNGNCYICHSSVSGKTATGFQPPQDNATLTYSLKISTNLVSDQHYNPGTTSNARHSTTYNGGKFCWDCHDPHGDRVSGSGNIVMIGSQVSRATDNTFGIPVGGTAGADRVSPAFTARTSGLDYASTDNAAPFNGICEVCHLAASGITHFYNSASSNHFTTNCISCHGHDVGFRGAGGSNQEQFFDGGYRADNAANYRDLSGHRILSGTTAAGLYDGTQLNCYSCHGVDSTNRQANECLKCHYENRTTGTPQHPNGLFEWATPTAPATPLASYPSGSVDANDALCLACHGLAGGATGTTLNAVAAPNILPTTTESWTGGSGHGATASLSTGFAGPAAYHCADCHKSTAYQTGGTSRDQVPGGVHGSINRKLVRNDNAAAGGQEYPDPADTFYNTVNLRSARMDSYCASKCHGNLLNGQAKDDNVVDHAWDILAGQSKTGVLTHPSDMTPVPGVLFRAPDNLPLSENLTGAPPAGAGNEVCVTCHNPHGGGNLVNNVGAPLTGGAKQMLRRSFSDNASSICTECHL